MALEKLHVFDFDKVPKDRPADAVKSFYGSGKQLRHSSNSFPGNSIPRGSKRTRLEDMIFNGKITAEIMDKEKVNTTNEVLLIISQGRRQLLEKGVHSNCKIYVAYLILCTCM